MSERFPFGLPSRVRLKRKDEFSSLERIAEFARLNALSEDWAEKFPSSDLDERIANLSPDVDFSNDLKIWHRAFYDLNVAGGGTILFDVYGESTIFPLDGLSTIIIPRVYLLRDELGNLVERDGRPVKAPWFVVFEGLSRSSCQITARNFGSAQPVFEWDNSISNLSSTSTIKTDPNNSSVDQFIWRNMTIRHAQGGTAIRHTNSPEIEERTCRINPVEGCIKNSETNQELRNCTFSNLRLSSDESDAEVAIIDIIGAKFNVFRDLIFEGAGQKKIGFRIRGDRNIVETLFSPMSTRAPATFLDFQSSNSILSHARTEGGNSEIADYYIHDCQNVDIQNLLGEGFQSQNIILIKNCQNITLRTIVTPRIDEILEPSVDPEEPEPTGLRFDNSQYCTVIGSTLSAQSRVNGKALVFDSNSRHNTILSTRVVDTLDRNQIRDIGPEGGVDTNNRWTVVEENTDERSLFIMPE